jgi:amino acid transporter
LIVTNIVFLSLIAFFVITITCLAESNPKQSSDFVWKEFVNTSGWSSDGVVFLTGLVNPNFIFSGLDGAIHLAEECTNAAVAVPRALLSTVVIGFVTGLAFAIGMCYSYHDFDAVLASSWVLVSCHLDMSITLTCTDTVFVSSGSPPSKSGTKPPPVEPSLLSSLSH